MTYKKPKTCLLTVTNSCVLRCKMCHLWQLNTAEDEISIDECKKFINSLSQFSAEPLEVHLIGGESLIKKGILELVRHMADSGLRTVITSSGYTIDETMAQALVNSGLSVLNLSLDSLNSSVHNSLRGRDDCFKRVMDAIGYFSRIKKNGFKVGINTVISASNLGDIIELTELVNNNKDLESIYFMAVMRPFGSNLDWQWYEKKEYDFLWPKNHGKVDSIIDKLIELKRAGHKVGNPVEQFDDFKSYFHNPQKFIRGRKCGLSHYAINVNAIGDVYLCFFMESLGNIKDRNIDIKELWTSEKAEIVREKMIRCQKNCELIVNCYYGE